MFMPLIWKITISLAKIPATMVYIKDNLGFYFFVMKRVLLNIKAYVEAFFAMKTGNGLPRPDGHMVISYFLIGLVTPVFYMSPVLISRNRIITAFDAMCGVIVIGFICYIAISALKGKQLLLFYKTMPMWLAFYVLAVFLLIWMYFILPNPFCYIALMVLFLPMIPLLLSAGILLQYLRRAYLLNTGKELLQYKIEDVDLSFLGDLEIHHSYGARAVPKRRHDVTQTSTTIKYQAKATPQEPIPMPNREFGPVTAPIGSVEWAVQVSDNIDKS